MNRVIRISMLLAVLMAFTAPVFAQGSRSVIERKIWYVDGNKRIAEAQYWRIFLGDYQAVQLRRTFPGEGQITVEAGMNFQLLSSGYIEGNGASSRGRVNSLPRMQIVINGQPDAILIDDIDYIFDYGTKVVTKDGRRGDFQFLVDGVLMTPRRFQITVFVQSVGAFGEPELNPSITMLPIPAVAFSREAATRASQEAITD